MTQNIIEEYIGKTKHILYKPVPRETYTKVSTASLSKSPKPVQNSTKGKSPLVLYDLPTTRVAKASNPPRAPPSDQNDYKKEQTSNSVSVTTSTLDNSSKKCASIFFKNDKRAWSVYTNSYGQVYQSTLDCSILNGSWSTPTVIPELYLTSSLHLLYTVYHYPILVGVNGDMLVMYNLDPGHNHYYVEVNLPSSSIQGIYAYTKPEGTYAQVAIISNSGSLYISYLQLYASTCGFTSWNDWGSGWGGAPCISYSSSTIWFVAKYLNNGRPYLSYCWSYLNDPTNYGMWHNMNYVSGADIIGSPTISRNTNSNGTVLIAIFIRTNSNALAYSVQDSADSYPESSFTKFLTTFPLEQDIQFPDLGLNFAPMVTLSKNIILTSTFFNKERNISPFTEMGSDSIFTSNIVVDVPTTESIIRNHRTQVFTFSIQPSGQLQSYDSGEYLLPISYLQ